MNLASKLRLSLYQATLITTQMTTIQRMTELNIFWPVSRQFTFPSQRSPQKLELQKATGACLSVAAIAVMVVLCTLTGCGGGTTSLAGPAIAFESTRAVTGSDASIGITNIWRMNQAGSALLPLTKITTANVSSGEPVWSPDGSKIAFSSTRALDGSDAANTNFASNIWVMNADGSSSTPLTRLTVPIAISPRWSPDGTKILFSSFSARWMAATPLIQTPQPISGS